MTVEAVIGAIAFLVVLIVIFWVDREGPEPPPDDLDAEARRWLAEHDDDEL